MVLDGLVISAPRVEAIITNGQAVISGSFTRDSAATLASQLNFGALPLTFEVKTEQTISATLGSEQLQRGILAGLIGLALVAVYSIFQYRGLASVTIASLIVAGGITYVLIALLSWTQGYRLSLPGVAGLIVAIGITADSFIVYFERVRDELRDGRTLPSAVSHAWTRARRTILASDAVNFLAATVLYFLAVGGVRGFAFTLGLVTIVDLVVVFMFTHPMLELLARTRFFAEGHRFSGLDASQLTEGARYAGRGRIAMPGRPGVGDTAAAVDGRRRRAGQADDDRRAEGRRACGSDDRHRWEGRLMASTRMSRWGADLYTGHTSYAIVGEPASLVRDLGRAARRSRSACSPCAGSTRASSSRAARSSRVSDATTLAQQPALDAVTAVKPDEVARVTTVGESLGPGADLQAQRRPRRSRSPRGSRRPTTSRSRRSPRPSSGRPGEPTSPARRSARSSSSSSW